MVWTDELADKVLDMWNSKTLSASDIAERVGLTRNQVISKVQREYKKLLKEAIEKKVESFTWRRDTLSVADAVERMNNPVRGIQLHMRKPARDTYEPVYIKRPPNFVADPNYEATYNKKIRSDAKHLPLIELEPRQCRFPTSEKDGIGFLFCGHPTIPNSSYCEHCHRITRKPPKQ